MSKERRIDPRIETFVNGLEALVEGDQRASLARLKRGAGGTLAAGGSLMPLFYRLLPPGVTGDQSEEDYFLVATLFPFAPSKSTEPDRRWKGDLGRSLRVLKEKPKVNEDGIDRRMTLLLGAGRIELPFRLRQTVRLMAQHDTRLDWRQLLQDLRAWEHEKRYVQKRWARSYFGWMADEATTKEVARETGDRAPRTESDDE